MLCSDTNIHQLFATVASVLDNMCTWFAVNKLSLNVSKTCYMLFRSNVQIDLETVEVVKFLGVIIDEQLNWKAHIASIKCKTTAILYKCSQLIDPQSMRILYCSVFLPYINYCSEIILMALFSFKKEASGYYLMLTDLNIRLLCFAEQMY